MATGPIRVRFKGICCRYLDGSNNRSFVLVEAGRGRSVKYLAKSDNFGTTHTRAIPPHLPYIGVDDPNDIISPTPRQLRDHYYGFPLNGEEVTIDAPGTNITESIPDAEQLKNGNRHFLSFGNFVPLTAASCAANVPITGGTLTSYKDAGDDTVFIEWVLQANLDGKGNVTFLHKGLGGGNPTTFFTVKPMTTVIISNESDTSGGGSNMDHFYLYALLSQSTVKVDDTIPPSVSFDCSNSQYP